MNRWRDWDDYRATKKPPPPDGIKIKKAGATWWGQRWIEALQAVLRGDAGRLARGRTYARAGRTHDLVVERGKVKAKVTGSRATPYAIVLELSELTDEAWTKAIAGMAEKAQFSAELLSGQMPKEIDDVFRAASCSLFPREREELKTSCSCPDWGDPCKHVAATHYVLGEALDRDPFLLFELRGRSKDQVLTALRRARGADLAMTDTKAQDSAADALATPGVALGKIAQADYDRAPAGLPALHFSFDAPATHGALLQQLGVPSAWTAASSPVEALAPIVRRAADEARRLALSDLPGAAQIGVGEQPAKAPASRAKAPPAEPPKGRKARVTSVEPPARAKAAARTPRKAASKRRP